MPGSHLVCAIRFLFGVNREFHQERMAHAAARTHTGWLPGVALSTTCAVYRLWRAGSCLAVVAQWSVYWKLKQGILDLTPCESIYNYLNKQSNCSSACRSLTLSDSKFSAWKNYLNLCHSTRSHYVISCLCSIHSNWKVYLMICWFVGMVAGVTISLLITTTLITIICVVRQKRQTLKRPGE